ncbi:hypothetical protein GGX14DRAFT_368123 [Mycena pura]|uniref:Tyr recombinase domain-containing protein n=1 Tax=Mycena pura TaxID=153505 RepID=A0AAD6V8H1_9AGAR|nr:hypothetical protein GGX14DRAFT_368123 [Mycena pura]
MTKASKSQAISGKKGTGKKGTGKKKGKTLTGNGDTLKAKKAEIQAEFSNAPRTKSAYNGYVARGLKILADIVADRRQEEKRDPSVKEDGIDVDVLATAFDGPPNKHSVHALGLYLAQKCVVEELGRSTAEGIQGAFAKLWDQFPGGKYTGEYVYDEESGKVRGNPARAPEIQSFLKCVKNKARLKGAAATRHHAEAATIEDMRQMMQWSENQCPLKKLEQGAQSAADLLLMEKHVMMRAFLSTGFVLWTRHLINDNRNFETCQIQFRDLSDCKGPSPYCLPYLGVFLDNRKGWQQKQGYDGPLESNSYKIYGQQETPEIDMFMHVNHWRILYRQILGRDFEEDDYLFPFISANGTIHAKRPMTHDTAQELLNEFARGAGIDKIFSTHCLRRGGSQYRFMYAPLGKRWSLTIIRWWGGWAAGEHENQVDTLMKYLLDSLQSYESGHGDALYPLRTAPEKSFMGEHTSLQPPTTAEFRIFGDQLMAKLDGLASVSTTTTAGAYTTTALMQQTSFPPPPLPLRLTVSPARPTLEATSCHVSQANNSHPGQAMSNSDSDSSLGSIPDISGNTFVPIPGAIIPGVGKDEIAWKRAIDQWFDGDPARGLTIPLKDWPAEMYTGRMRLITGTLYSNRKILAEEFQRYVYSRLSLLLLIHV